MGQRVVIGVGANLGDRLGTLREAVARIAELADLQAVSSVYETAPIGGPEQPAFLNAAVAVIFRGDPLDLLAGLQRIERDLGRVRDVRWGPRTIDLDVLWVDGVTSDDPRLVIPHPRLKERAFALLPLLDVAPDVGAAYEIPPNQGVVRTTMSLREER